MPPSRWPGWHVTCAATYIPNPQMNGEVGTRNVGHSSSTGAGPVIIYRQAQLDSRYSVPGSLSVGGWQTVRALLLPWRMFLLQPSSSTLDN